MAKRKRKSKFNAWYLLFLIPLIASTYYIYWKSGWEGIIETIAIGIFTAVFVASIVRLMMKNKR